MPMPTMTGGVPQAFGMRVLVQQGPVIQRDAPVFVAILPSSVMAYFNVT